MFIKIRAFLLRQDGFLSNVAVLASATVMAQLINVLSMPVFSRIYSPSDFGTLSLFSAVVGLLSTVSGFRYHLAIPLVRTERYLISLIWASLIFQAIFILLVILVLEVVSDLLIGSQYSVLIPYRFFIVFGVLCVGIYNLLTQWAIRTKSFTLLAKTKLIQTVSRVLAVAMLGVFNLKPLGLLLGNVFGQSFGSSSLLRELLKKSKKKNFNLTYFKRVVLSYRKMFFFETPSALLNMSGAYFLPIILAYFFMPEVVGSFSMSQQILSLPSALIGTAIGQVYIQRASEAKLKGNIADIVLKTMLMLFRIGTFPILTIGLLSPSVFVFFLGEKWFLAGQMAQIISPWVALDFVYTPLSMTFIIMMLQKPAFVFVSIYTLLRIFSLYLGRHNPIIAVTLLSLVGTVCICIGISIFCYYVRINIRKMFYGMTRAYIEILIELAPIIAIVIYFNNSVPLLYSILSLALGMLFYLYFNFRQLEYYKN